MHPRRLVLIRHAQAGNAPLDKDRPLTEAGAGHAAAIGTWLAKAGTAPDRAAVSPARRATQTWELAAASLEGSPEPALEPRIYENTLDALLATIAETPDDVRTLVLVGHNPAIAALAAELDDGQGDAAARQQLEVGFPAGGLAVFELTVPFAEIAPGTATLSDVAVPGH